MAERQVQPPPLNCPCDGRHFSPVFVYTEPPDGEVRFPFSSGRYHREVLRCDLCGHFVSLHAMDTSALYSAEYVDATYGKDGIRQSFERIIALDPANSDNTGRVARITEFARHYLTLPGQENRAPTVLDVGAGLCVFLHRMKVAGWEGTALDPDERAIAHAREVVGIQAICADFMTVAQLGRFDLVTFNKVLEHIQDPVAMLARAAAYVNKSGSVYVELPDGEAAVLDGPGREEFFIEHYHIFSMASLAMLAERAGFHVIEMERVREPSAKYTLRAFLSPTL